MRPATSDVRSRLRIDEPFALKNLTNVVERSTDPPAGEADLAQPGDVRELFATVLKWQRCTVHFLRNMLGHVQNAQQPMIATAIRQLFGAASREQASERLAEVVDRLERPAPKVARLLLEAKCELLACYEFAKEHWSKLRSTNPLERVNREIGRRTDVVGIFL